jgi:hypothetical protein
VDADFACRRSVSACFGLSSSALKLQAWRRIVEQFLSQARRVMDLEGQDTEEIDQVERASLLEQQPSVQSDAGSCSLRALCPQPTP